MTLEDLVDRELERPLRRSVRWTTCAVCRSGPGHAQGCPEDTEPVERPIPAHTPRTYAELVARSRAAHPGATR